MERGASYRKPGVVSIRVGVAEPDLKATRGVDILKELCGVDSYDPDDQEVILAPGRRRSPRPVADLVGQLSYSESFLPAVVAAAADRGIDRVYWAVAQFDFAYHPERVRTKVGPDPVFLGMFPWQEDEDDP